MDKIEIALSKSKMIKLLLGSIAFVLIGIWILIYQPDVNNSLFNNPVVKYSAAIASIIFFGFTMVYSILKLMDKKAGIIIDHEGIFDNSSAVSVGLIRWTDIKNVAKLKIMKQEFVIVSVINPEYYLDKERNLLKRKSRQYNYKNYGSPVTITASSLKCNVDELILIIEKSLAHYRQK